MTDLRDLDDTQIWPAPRSDAGERTIPTQLLLIDCPDEVGLIHKITSVLFRAGLSIVSLALLLEERVFLSGDRAVVFE